MVEVKVVVVEVKVVVVVKVKVKVVHQTDQHPHCENGRAPKKHLMTRPRN